MRHFGKLALGKLALGALGAVVFSTAAAQAAIVCNNEGDCWRVKKSYHYKPAFGLKVYPDTWRWKNADKGKYRWREAHGGRGYWHNGVWITF